MQPTFMAHMPQKSIGLSKGTARPLVIVSAHGDYGIYRHSVRLVQMQMLFKGFCYTLGVFHGLASVCILEVGLAQLLLAATTVEKRQILGRTWVL